MLIAICVILFSALTHAKEIHRADLSINELELLREETRGAFLHAYDSYMKHAFPHDELMPLSCLPRRHDERARGTLDDVLGGYMLTLVDSLDSLVIMREYERFAEALVLLEKGLTFDTDISISVFEANIRVLGGLLSAHQLASTLFDASVYDGNFLLDRAIDLGNRLLPAFQTRTGVPIHKINLRHGIEPGEESRNCPAAGASFLVEMGLLSRLSGDPRYETAAKRAVRAVWDRRSKLHLIGAMMDTKSGAWTETHSGIGAGIDSYFETMLKGHILLGDMDLLQWFEDAYEAIQYHTMKGGVHIEVQMATGRHGPAYSGYVSALQAFWPGLQVLAGHVLEAEESFFVLEELWSRHKMLPDMFDTARNKFLSHSHGYPLRPELIESAYHVFTATGKQKYVKFVKEAFYALQNYTKTDCGYAAISDVRSGRLDDRMDSYFLSETLMYTFLTFDEALPPQLRKSIFCNHDSSETALCETNLSTVCQSLVAEPHAAGMVHEIVEIEKDSIVSGLRGGIMSMGRNYSVDDLCGNSTSASQCATECKNSVLNFDTKVDVKVRNTRQCIQKVSTLFSTEGHLLVIDPNIRPLLARHSNSRSIATESNADRHTCNAPPAE